MKLPKQGLALLAIILTTIMWGLSFISIKIALVALPPMTMALTRFIVASVLLMPTLKLIEPGSRLELRDYPKMALAGFMGVTAYFFFENNGVKLLTASAASITIATIPIFTLLADALFFHNKLTKGKLASVIVSIVGVYLVVGADYKELLASGQGIGYLAMLGACFSWVAYSIATKDLCCKYTMLAITAYQSVFGALTTLPFALLETTDWTLVNSIVVVNVAFLGIFCSALGYYLYAYALSKLGMGVTSMFVNLIPVVAVVASFFILGERITGSMIYGGLLVIGGVSLLSWPGKADGADQAVTPMETVAPVESVGERG